jgi:HSP20 family protein
MLLRRLTDWPTSRWASPFEELERMQRQMDWLTGSLSRGVFGEPAAGVFPLMNVTEDKDSFYVRAELPGLKPDQLNISVTGNTLSLSGERKIPTEDASARYHRREREAGKFSRIVTLPSQVNTGKVEARCKDGILTITLPKAESAKPKQIAIKAS